MLILFVNMGNNMSKNKINNNDFITTKINKLLSQLETQVEQVFGEFSEDELKELLDNDLGEIIFNWKGQAQEEQGRRNQQKLIDFTLGKQQ
jgi:hypothetical protein